MIVKHSILSMPAMVMYETKTGKNVQESTIYYKQDSWPDYIDKVVGWITTLAGTYVLVSNTRKQLKSMDK